MISVVIPIYNTSPEYFRECVESILAQTLVDFEVLVVDNGSSEDHYRQYEKICEDPRIQLHKIERVEGMKNLSRAVNHGIKNSKFDLIARMDADDTMVKDRLQKQVDYFENNRVDILGGQIKFMGTNRIKSHPEEITLKYPLTDYWVMNHPTVAFRKARVVEIGGYSEKPEYLAEDYELWTRALSKGLKLKNMQEVLVHYRVTNSSLTNLDKSNKKYNLLISHIRDVYRNKVSSKIK